jgi:hypothetical protein
MLMPANCLLLMGSTLATTELSDVRTGTLSFLDLPASGYPAPVVVKVGPVAG